MGLLVPAIEREVWSPVARAFETAGHGARVDLVEGPNSTDLRESLYTAALLAGDDSFDLVLMDVTWAAKFAAAGWLVALDEAFRQEELTAFLPQALAAGRYAGRLYRLPTSTDVGVPYYRRDWLADWQDCLRRLAYDEGLAASIRGYSLRLLFDLQQVDEHEPARLAGCSCQQCR